MRYREWRQWLSEIPWALRWFVLLVLVRPVLDTLYFLKDISPFLSPPYVIGALTPILIIASLSSRSIGRIQWSLLDRLFVLWGALMVFNALAVLAIGISLVTIEVSLKLATPVLIYVFLRHLIQSRRDLVGVLTCFLYSAVPVFGMMLYERFVSPFQSDPTFTRGFYRYSGLYGDIVSYSVYFVGTYLIAGYLFLSSAERASIGRAAVRFAFVAGLCVLGFLQIHHNMSWGVAAALSSLLLFQTFSGRKLGSASLLLAIFFVLGIFFHEDVGQRVGRSLETEIAVLDGRAGQEKAFHGRMSRWNDYLDRWDEQAPLAKAFGVSLMSDRAETGMLFGIHTDYLRIMFASGVVGLAFYLAYFLRLILCTWQVRGNGEQFLLRGGIAIMLLFSISTVPTLYFGLLYLCLSIFAFAALPAVSQRSALQGNFTIVGPYRGSYSTRTCP